MDKDKDKGQDAPSSSSSSSSSGINKMASRVSQSKTRLEIQRLASFKLLQDKQRKQKETKRHDANRLKRLKNRYYNKFDHDLNDANKDNSDVKTNNNNTKSKRKKRKKRKRRKSSKNMKHIRRGGGKYSMSRGLSMGGFTQAKRVWPNLSGSYLFQTSRSHNDNDKIKQVKKQVACIEKLFNEKKKHAFYDILGVDQTASLSDIKKAYHKLALKVHPDKDEFGIGTDNAFKAVGHAYEVLSDEESRQEYDPEYIGRSAVSSDSSGSASTPATAASSTANTAAGAPKASSDKSTTKAEEWSERRRDVLSASKVSSNKTSKSTEPPSQRAVKQTTKMRSKKHMLGRLVLISGACASAAAENVVGSTKSIEKKDRLGSSSSGRVHVHGLNEEDDVQAEEDPSSFTVFQRMKQEGVHLQEDVPRHMNAPVASHDVGVLSSKGDEEGGEDTLLSQEHRRRRRRAKMNSSHLPHDVDVSTNDGGYDKVEEGVLYAKMEENRMIQLVNEREDDEVAPVTKRMIKRLTARQARATVGATSSSSGVQGGSATATKTNQNNDFGALDVNEYQGEYGDEDENKERVYYDEERVLVHQEEAYDPAAYDVTTAAASYENRQLAVNLGMSGSCPPEDVVTCVDGFASSVGNVTYAAGSNVTCQDACAGGCCVGNGSAVGSTASSPNYARGDPINSCTLFNGKVCKSGAIRSCSDERTSGDPLNDGLGRACYRANITEVFNGCNGKQACYRIGVTSSRNVERGYPLGGGIGRVVNGCHGENSCSNAASKGGYIKEIVDSCIGKVSCNGAAIGTSNPTRGGNIGSITNGSCDGENSCFRAAYGGGNIGYINHGCRGVEACRDVAYYGGSWAAGSGSIDGISYACNNIEACKNMAGSFDGYFDSIDSAVVSCCNGASECLGSIVNASGLPDQCGTSSPTNTPTTEPTGSPITASPSVSPSINPSQQPTVTPSQQPTVQPTGSPITASPSLSPINTPTTASPSSPPSVNPSQQPTTDAPAVAPSTNPTVSPVLASPTSSPQALTLAPTTSPTALVPEVTQSVTNTLSVNTTDTTNTTSAIIPEARYLRGLREFACAPDATISALEETTKSIVEPALSSDQELKSIDTVACSQDGPSLIVTQKLEISVTCIQSCELAAADLEASNLADTISDTLAEAIVSNNFTRTLQENAAKCKPEPCTDLAGATVDEPPIVEAGEVAVITLAPSPSPTKSPVTKPRAESAAPSIGKSSDVSSSPTSAPSSKGEPSDVASSPTSAPSSKGESSDISSSPTGTPSSKGEPSDVASASGKSGKSSSAVSGVSKASKKSEASSKSSKSVKSANTEPQESAELDKVEEVLEESIALGIDEVEEPKESAKLDVDEEEDIEDVTKDEEDEAEEDGVLDMLAKMLGGWW